MSTEENNQVSTQTVMQQIQSTPAGAIAELDFVKNKFIQNYNLCHKSNQGDIQYHRQVVHFKQLIANNNKLAQCQPFSLYACFLTASVKGYSFDPADDEVYLIPTDGKARLQRQAGAHIRRLIMTAQIVSADQAKLVYHGDVFEVMNGRVMRHVECFASDTIIAAYLRVILNQKGDDKYFIYRKSDWEAWRKKSPNPKTVEKVYQGNTYLSKSPWDNETIGGAQPDPGFLRTKIVSHAAKEKCWATGSLPVAAEHYEDIEVEVEEVAETDPTGQSFNMPYTPQAPATSAVPVVNAAMSDDFNEQQNQPATGKTLTDDDF